MLLKKDAILDFIYNVLQYHLNLTDKTIADLLNMASKMLYTDVYTVIAIILIGNGAVKVVLAIGLFFRDYLSFILGFVFFIGLLIYQIVENFHYPSKIFAAFNLLDAIIVFIIWREFLALKKKRAFRR